MTAVATHDIVVIGGGLVGASLAVALAPLGYRVAVVEAVSPRARQQPSYDDRTLALNHASCRILAGIGLWPELSERATPIRKVSVSEWQRPGCIALDPGEMGVDAFGHVVEARAFGEAVLERARSLDSIEWICPARLVATSSGENLRSVTLEDGRVLAASLLVGADGARSTLREALGIEVQHRDYQQVAVIANVMPQKAHDGQAFECLTPSGPFALLPHVEGRCGLVWCVNAGHEAELLAMEDDEFLARATARSGGVLGELRQLGRRSHYPLHQVMAERDRAPRALLLGNAAHAIHPAGAQGFNLGLRDVAVLTELLATARHSEADPGSDALLGEYSDWRREDQAGTAAWSDGIVALFERRGPLADRLRTLGFLAHSVAPPLRRRVAAQAMGYRGRIPRLALGEPLT